MNSHADLIRDAIARTSSIYSAALFHSMHDIVLRCSQSINSSPQMERRRGEEARKVENINPLYLTGTIHLHVEPLVNTSRWTESPKTSPKTFSDIKFHLQQSPYRANIGEETKSPC